jgi:sulfite exporter TauE/SafE
LSLFIAMFLAGLAISAHCVTMCGTLVLSYAIKGDEEGPLLKRMLPHVAYQSARAASYVLVGLALGAIGSAFNIAGIRPYVMVFAGAYMILMGLNMTGKFPILRYIAPRPPKFMMTLVGKLRRKAKADEAAGESTLATPFMFGAITGLMPCGPLQSAQIAAAGAGSAASGAFAMLGFWAGTMPLMLGFGAVSSLLSARFRKYMLVAGSIAIMLVGAVMLNRGAMLAGSPVTFDTVARYAVGGQAASAQDSRFKTGADGVVEIPLTIANTRFQPQTVTIPADKPVRLIVDRREADSCSKQLAVPTLGILATLKDNGVTTVDLPAAKAGSYTLTCGMGMMSGRLDVGGGVPASSGSRLPLFGLIAVAVGAGVWVYRRRTTLPEPQRAPAPRKGGKGQKGKRPDPVPAPSGLFGFTSAEAIVIGAAVVTAIVAGLFLGGIL